MGQEIHDNKVEDEEYPKAAMILLTCAVLVVIIELLFMAWVFLMILR